MFAQQKAGSENDNKGQNWRCSYLSPLSLPLTFLMLVYLLSKALSQEALIVTPKECLGSCFHMDFSTLLLPALPI